MNRTTSASWVKMMAGIAALSFTLAACGSEEETPDASEPTASESESQSGDAPAVTDDECAGDATSANAFKVGGILPLTGNLAFLGPPEIAGVGLAVSDINAAGGVNGLPACYQILDSGDSTDMSISTASASSMVAGQPSVVVGAASSSVSLNFVDTLTQAKIVQISPANTAVDLSGYSDFYFRTAPPDGIQGAALGTQITTDGYTNVAFLVFNDTYGTGLRNVIQETIEGAGGACVYGCKGEGNEFPAGQTTFTSDVSAALATNPDAIVVLAFDETKSIVPELAAQGWDMSKTYFTDGNLSDYSADFEEGTLEGAIGSLPGADAEDSFKEAASAWSELAQGEALRDYSYSAESYDAAILAALAAVKAGSTVSADIQKQLAAVSGATGGEECTTFAECAEMIAAGSEIKYTGPSGIGPFDEENDPSSAFVGIYQYGPDNTYELLTTVEGQK